MPQPGIDQLKHIVVLMMENRSFDHLLGYMMAQDARIDGVDGTQTNPDTTGALAPVQPLAQYQSQLQPDPGHHYPDVDLQIFGDPRAAAPNMQGFIKAYYQKQNNVSHSHNIMYCFPPEKVPVITTLASNHHVLLPAGESPGDYHARLEFPVIQPLVLLASWTHDSQPRLRAFRHFVREDRHGPVLSRPKV